MKVNQWWVILFEGLLFQHGQSWHRSVHIRGTLRQIRNAPSRGIPKTPNRTALFYIRLIALTIKKEMALPVMQHVHFRV